MESANFYLHHQEEHHLVDPSFSGSQNPILNETNHIINSRNLDTGTTMEYPIENFVSHELQRLARIKDEFSVAESYPKFLELLNGSPTSINEDLLHLHPYSNGTLSQIFPTISIPSLNQFTTTSSSSSSSFDMNCLPALSLFGSPRFDVNFNYHASFSAPNHGAISSGFDRMHQAVRRPSFCPTKITSVSTTGRTDESANKRPAATKCVHVPPKKSKLEPRPSSAPLIQVRKEKLGDKVAAIQQLVAPFGKTDTASVLMEAIGYIKFLQTQVETLSVPYMKSRNKINGGIYEAGRQMEDGKPKAKKDLVSRGLCLVPLSCLSYITDINGGIEGIWPPP